jgi:TP901 family phage tail tape measure protein
MNIPSKIGNIIISLGKLAVAAGVATAALGVMGGIAFGVQAIKTMMSFETQMSKLRSIAGATGEQFDALKTQAKDLGRTTEWSATQVADAQIQLAKTGLNTAEILSSTAPMLQLATVGQLDLGRASDIATNTMSQFNLEADSMGQVAGVMALTANKSAQTVEDLAEAFSYLGPVASSLNMSLEDTASITARLADVGLKGSRGNRVLATSLQRLAKPTKAMEGSMRALNVQFFDSEGQFRAFPDIIEDLSTKMAGLTQEQKMYHTATLFGNEATGSWLKLVEGGAEPLRQLAEELGTSEEALQQLAFEALGPTERAMFNLQSAYEGVLLSFSEAGVLDLVAFGMQKIADVMVKLAEKIETYVAPKMMEFLEYLKTWYNAGGRDAIERFVRTAWSVFEGALIRFVTYYWPIIKDNLKAFEAWFNSPEGQASIERWVSQFESFAQFVLKAVDGFLSLADAVSKVADQWNKLPEEAKSALRGDAQGVGRSIGERIGGIFRRSTGGPVEANTMYQVGENNRPEILESGGRQYMIPGDKGRVLREGQVDSKQSKPQVQKVVTINNYNTSPDEVFTSNSLLFARLPIN